MDGGDLFTSAARERLVSRSPLAARLRPRTIDDVVGQRHLVGPGRPLRQLVEQEYFFFKFIHILVINNLI